MSATTLTDRYVWAVTRLLPERQRPEVRHELEASIADMIEANVPDGAAVEAAERQVLTELGDPRRLAARYVDRPRYLIGPDVFPYYINALRRLAVIVLPLVGLVAALGKVLDDAPVADVVLAAFVGVLTAGVHLFFWLTLAVAVFAPRPEGKAWSLDDLPEPLRPSRVGLSETVWSMVFLAIAIGALVWQQQASPFVTDEGTRVPLLDPGLWPGWMSAVIIVLLASTVVELAAYRARQWTTALATINGVLNAAVLGLVAWAALAGELVNPDVLELIAREAELSQVPTVNAGLVILAVGAVAAWDTVDAFRKARQASMEA